MKQFLDWSSYEDAGMGDAYADIPKTGGNFAKAVAVCIGSKQCEEKGRGVMCPSYRISDNPNLSTGGRVKLLKKALNGEFGNTGLLQPELVEAMDLCVSCKGCKRECENGVDMATIKVEYLAQYNTQRGISWRAQLFARLPQWLHRKPWLRSFIVLRNRIPLVALLGEKFLGISANLPLPIPSEESFDANSDNATVPEQPREQEKDEINRNEVVLFVDTLSFHFEPEIAKAAFAVLESAGYKVTIAKPQTGSQKNDRPLCCGRSYLSQGMVQEAKQEARRTVAALLPHIQAGRPIIGLEPSCLLMLRDEYLTLGLGEEAKSLASQAMLLEEFLAKEISAKRLNLNLQQAIEEAPALIHGHCHQKAVGAMKSMRKVLKLIPGLSFDNIEAGCCGMAGSFGLEAEHYPLGRQMAEQELLPALRSAPQATVIANGFSCRQQIQAGSDHQPIHLAVYLHKQLSPPIETQ
jgi:glycerol-3-phosphate dehydrogenase subunit C